MAPKKKRASLATVVAEANGAPLTTVPIPLPKGSQPAHNKRKPEKNAVNPNERADILDAPNALRASPDSEVDRRLAPNEIKQDSGSDSPLSDVPDVLEEKPKKLKRSKAVTAGNAAKEVGDEANTKRSRGKRATGTVNGSATQNEKRETPSKVVASQKSEGKSAGASADPEADDEVEADEEEVKEALSRPPPVHSDYLPLPWKGRLGYVSGLPRSPINMLTTYEGLLEYVPALLKSPGFQLSNVPHCFHS